MSLISSRLDIRRVIIYFQPFLSESEIIHSTERNKEREREREREREIRLKIDSCLEYFSLPKSEKKFTSAVLVQLFFWQ